MQNITIKPQRGLLAFDVASLLSAALVVVMVVVVAVAAAAVVVDIAVFVSRA